MSAFFNHTISTIIPLVCDSTPIDLLYIPRVFSRDQATLLLPRLVGRSEDTFEFLTLMDAHLPKMTLDDL